MIRTGMFLGVLFPLCFLTGGCVTTQPIPVTLQYETDSNSMPSLLKSSVGECLVEVQSIEDARSNKESIGLLNTSPVITDDVTEWIREGLNQRVSNGIQLAWEGDSSPLDLSGDFSAKIFISRIFVHANTVRLHGTVILRVLYKTKESLPVKKIYRGDGDVFAWTRDSALKKALNDALTVTILKINDDLNRFCLNPGQMAQAVF